MQVPPKYSSRPKHTFSDDHPTGVAIEIFYFLRRSFKRSFKEVDVNKYY